MAYEQKDNSGSVFKNERKEKDTHPDRTGSAMIGGVAYWVNGWVKQDRNGNQFLSLSFKPKESRAEVTDQEIRQTRREDNGRASLNDEIPFAAEFR